MEWDWTSYVLQIINFLVLVWLLKRLLYRPVMDVIAQRQRSIVQATNAAQQTRAQAEALQKDLQRQLAEHERHQAEAMAKLADEVATERQHRMARLEAELQKETERRNALAEARVQDAIRQARTTMEDGVYGAVASLLQRLASEDLDRRLLDLLIEDLPGLPSPQRDALRDAANGAPLELTTARPMSQEQQQRLLTALQEMMQRPLTLTECVEPALVAGLRVGIGPWQLAASVADELYFFRRGMRHV